MKKLVYTFALALFAFSFTACEADELPQDLNNNTGDQIHVPADREGL